ncbi:MAG: response regulator [Acidobacteriaceae bacterium]|nr:response regulator [Acidobacteriaceae bacterium]
MRIEEARILVVDDELELLEIFAAWLGRSGCEVFTAPNGAEALKILQSEQIDVLISDIRMPIMDGVTLVRQINEKEIVPPKILFVSGYGNISRREIHGLGVEALLDKPLSRQDLLQAMDRCLSDSTIKWLTPSTEPMDLNASLDMASLEKALATHAFTLGRGGCSLDCTLPLKEGERIDLSLRFAKEGLSLEAQGTVLWVDSDRGKAGVAFDYLSPECREWILSRIEKEAPRCFVPSC